VLLDARALQGPDAIRGVGTYVRGLLEGLHEVGFSSRLALLVDPVLPAPAPPAGSAPISSPEQALAAVGN